MRQISRRLAMAVLVALGAMVTSAEHAGAIPGEAVPDAPRSRRGGTTPIADVNANNASGQSDLEFTIVDIEGIVQLSSGRLDPFDRATASSWFVLADATGSVVVTFPGGAVNPVPTVGDRLRVNSVVFTQGGAPVRGTRTLDFEVFGMGTVTNLGTGTPDPATTISAADLQSSGSAYEGKRVRLDALTVVAPGEWPATGNSGFVRLTDGTSEIQMFVDEDTDLDGANPPATPFSLIGFVAQDANDFAAEGLHFVYPTGVTDLIAGDGSGALTVTPQSVLQASIANVLTFTLVGQEATLEQLELDLPSSWTWTDTADVSLSGAGFAGASVQVSSGGSLVTVRVLGASVTSTAPGVLTVGSLDAPSVAGETTFQARTATPGGTPTAIGAPPLVRVLTDAGPGDVVINELYPNTSLLSFGREESEFVEIRNRTSQSLDISGWTLADIGKTTSCSEDAKWRFPEGVTVPANGYLVICRTAFDAQGPDPADDRGFLVDFPEFSTSGAPLFEMFDSQVQGGFDVDHGATPNLLLVAPTFADDQMALLGGFVTNIGQCESPYVPGRRLPFEELVVLRDLAGAVIDAFEYRELGPCTVDFCSDGITGADDAYALGPPTIRHTLGRDAASQDTDLSRQDLFVSSNPTPGLVNLPGDTVAPNLVNPTAALSAGIVEVTFNEPVTDVSALDPQNYKFVTATGETLACRNVFPDPEIPGRHFYLVCDPLPGGESVTLAVRGVKDRTGANEGNAASDDVVIGVPFLARTICDVQKFDDVGFSPSVGDTVLIAGLVTFGDVDPVSIGAPPPTDRMSIWVQEPGGCGVNVFGFFPDTPVEYQAQFPSVREFGVRLNDFVVIRGVVTEFVSSTSGAGAVTEIAAITEDSQFYRFLLRGLEGPVPVVVGTKAAGDENLEGSLVQTEGVVISGDDRALFVDDGTGAIQVFSNFSPNIDLTQFTIGDRLRVTGVITQFDSTEPFFSGYELVPQSQQAIERLGGGFALSGPKLIVPRAVLVPDLHESLEIQVQTPARSDVIVEIYDAVGRKIITLYDGVGLGTVTFSWDGRGDDGNVVLPGAYLCHVRAVALDGGSVETTSAPIVVGARLSGSNSPEGVSR